MNAGIWTSYSELKEDVDLPQVICSSVPALAHFYPAISESETSVTEPCIILFLQGKHSYTDADTSKCMALDPFCQCPASW